MNARITLILVGAAMSAGCSSAMPGGRFLPEAPAWNAFPTGNLVVRVTFPNKRTRELAPSYVSAATKALKINVSGPSDVSKTVALSFSSKGCKSSLMTTQCELTIPLKACPTPKNCYTATVVTYDAYANGKVPKPAHKLSADVKFAFAIRRGDTLVPLTLYGIPASVAFVPGASSLLMGNEKGGFTEPKCTAAAERVSVVGLDADRNYIVGAGAPKVTLRSDDSAQLAVSRPQPSNPNEFLLVPPKLPNYPFGNHTIHLTAEAVPNKSSGGTVKKINVSVTYSGDVCGQLTEFTVPSALSAPVGIAAGRDGNLWFAEQHANKIGRVTLAGKFTEYGVLTANSLPTEIAAGADGDLWFSEITGNQIGQIGTNGHIREFAVPTASSQPIGITAGPDGNVWFTESAGNKIGRITPAGAITEYSVPTALSVPESITAGPDGNLWFTEYAADRIGLVTIGGSVSDFPVGAGSIPHSIATGSDGALWVTAQGLSAIERVTIVGRPTSFYFTTTASFLTDITPGPDGALWFAELSGGKIGRVAVSGNIVEYALPPGSTPYGITVGPDGAIWFTDTSANTIGRIR